LIYHHSAFRFTIDLRQKNFQSPPQPQLKIFQSTLGISAEAVTPEETGLLLDNYPTVG
jgi:hypothetical protein